MEPPRGEGWINHPAARMWKGYETALRIYYNAMVSERPSGTLRMIDTSGKLKTPPWLEIEQLHVSHRSRLHYKGTIDVLARRIRSQHGVRSAKTWLEAHGLPEMNILTRSQRDEAHRILDGLAVPANAGGSNWYDQFFWPEANTYQPYLWPESANAKTFYRGTEYDT